MRRPTLSESEELWRTYNDENLKKGYSFMVQVKRKGFRTIVKSIEY